MHPLRHLNYDLNSNVTWWSRSVSLWNLEYAVEPVKGYEV